MGVGSASVVDYANTYPGTASHVNATGSVGDFEVVVDGSGATTLSLNFQTATTLDPRITFTRASSATQYNSVGTLISVGSDVARFDYDPETLAPKGLLIEEQRTNLLIYSEQFDNAAWTKNNTTVSANVTIAPDGTLTADKLEPATTAATSIYQSVVIAASSYTGSVYVKKGSNASDANRFYLRDPTTSTTLLQVAIDYDTLVITYNIGSTGASVQNVGNGWLRVSLTITSSLTVGNTLRYGVCFVGGNETAGEFAYAWGAQLEAGASPTSYIPTTSATVTRAADNASMVGSNFSSWYNQSEGTVYAAVSFTNTSSFNTVYSITDGTISNAIRTIQWNNGTDRPLSITTASVGQTSYVTTGLIGGVKYCAAFTLNNANYAKNGVLGVDDTLVTLPTVNQLSFGSTAGSSFYLNGWLQSIKYYPTRLPNGTLQGLTTSGIPGPVIGSTPVSAPVPPPVGPTTIGEAWGGGYYAGKISTTGNGVATHYLIVSPKIGGESSTIWQTVGSLLGTSSTIDGPTNTNLMYAAGNCPAANFCKGLSIGGYTDWYLPAKDELEVLYYNLKPTTATNNISYGANPYAVAPEPINTNHTTSNPAQTTATIFRTGGSEALIAGYYWVSTEANATGVVQLDFTNGSTRSAIKTVAFLTRAIRRIPI
jgi:hypothetical protein